MASTTRLTDLCDQKIKKLHEQKQLSDQFNALLTKQVSFAAKLCVLNLTQELWKGGLNDASHQTIKQTIKMLASSRQPGMVPYHGPSVDIW